MSTETIVYNYTGYVDTSILKNILESLEAKLAEQGEDKLFRKKVNSIMIECLQNLIYYVDQSKATVKLPMVSVVKKESGYLISTGNLILSPSVKRLEEYLNKINGMTKEQQREFYQSVLTNGEFNEQGGAGLGFVNIARKTRDNRVGFAFEPVNNEYQYFTLHLAV